MQEALVMLGQEEPETERGRSIRWMGEYNLYQRLLSDEELRLADESLDVFYNEKGEGNMGRLYRAVNGFSAARRDNDAGGLAALQQVQPSNRVEQTLRELLDVLYANATDLRGMADEGVAQLRDIAQLCPLDDGLGVYMARSALLSIDTLPKVYISECEHISPEDAEKWKQDGITDGPDIFAVYPNPNNGSMTVAYHLQERETGVLRIYSTTGILVLEQSLTTSYNIMEVDIGSCGSGLYLVSIEVNGTKRLTQRISVIQ